MTKRGITDSEVEYLWDTDEDSVTGSSVDSIGDEDYPLGNTVLPWESAESIEITPTFSPDILHSENELPVSSTVFSGSNPTNGSRNKFTTTSKNFGVDSHVAKNLTGKDPIDFYNYFIDDEVISLFVTETNRHALQNIKPKPNRKRIPWSNTDTMEMRKFIGIILWMGLFRLPKIRDYWSTNVLYENNISKTMTRNRFELLLSNIRFRNPKQKCENDRLYEISAVLDMINEKFQRAYIPGEEVCINEGNVRISNKLHRYGIKLCVTGGYTWRYKVYAGEENVDGVSAEEKVVMEMMDGLLDSGRTLYTDNWLTSVPLAKTLINRDTHLVGILSSNGPNISEKVIQKELKKGEIISQQNKDNIVVLKWKDEWEVLMLSTKHDDSVVSLTIKGKNVNRPAALIDYNKGKAYTDLPDQIAAHSPYLQKPIKWYKRLVFYLITAVTVVNAHYLYNKISGKKMQLTKFRELLVEAMTTTGSPQPIPTLSNSSSRSEHVLKEVEGQKRKTRKRCKFCYKHLSISKGPEYARKNAKKINTICEKCKMPLCIDCFQKYHKNVL